jgi:hypothetical protein
MKMIVDTKVRKCDGIASSTAIMSSSALQCEDAKYYGQDALGKGIDLCDACYRVYANLISFGMLLKPIIKCHFCGKEERVDLYLFNAIVGQIDRRLNTELISLPFMACSECSTFYSEKVSLTGGGIGRAGLVPIFDEEKMKKKLQEKKK